MADEQGRMQVAGRDRIDLDVGDRRLMDVLTGSQGFEGRAVVPADLDAAPVLSEVAGR